MERNASAGYIALGKETTAGTAVTPSLYTPYYDQGLVTNANVMSDEPVYGYKFKRFQNLPGVRSHGGSVQVMAEPNTAAYWHDMLLTRTATSGAGPYEHDFGISGTTATNSYTMDISLVSQVVRFMGVQASKVSYGWQDDKMVLDVDTSALKSFYDREILSISGAGPYTIVLKSDGQYPRPTEGLVVGDLIQVYDVSAETQISCSVASIVDSTDITVTEDVSAGAAGDILTLRPATPALSLLTPFLWPRTEYRFADTAANALTATQTRLEPGTEVAIMHDFENDEGAKRSGDFDPASLPRLQVDMEFQTKVFLDDPQKFREWSELNKRACVMRAFAGASSEYELRVTMNHIKALTDETPTESASVIYHDVTYGPQYDTTDGTAFSVKIINNVASV